MQPLGYCVIVGASNAKEFQRVISHERCVIRVCLCVVSVSRAWLDASNLVEASITDDERFERRCLHPNVVRS